MKTNTLYGHTARTLSVSRCDNMTTLAESPEVSFMSIRQYTASDGASTARAAKRRGNTAAVCLVISRLSTRDFVSVDDASSGSMVLSGVGDRRKEANYPMYEHHADRLAQARSGRSCYPFQSCLNRIVRQTASHARRRKCAETLRNTQIESCKRESPAAQWSGIGGWLGKLGAVSVHASIVKMRLVSNRFESNSGSSSVIRISS